MSDKRIDGKGKSVVELLKGVKYSVDFYQREYKWGEKQIAELVEDLTGRFLADYDPAHPRAAVADYGQYFLGSVILSRREGRVFIVDGQQRLSSLTLLLLFLRRRALQSGQSFSADDLIFSEKYGEKTFNLDVPGRTHCMEVLWDGQTPDTSAAEESVRNLVARFSDIEAHFPPEIDAHAGPYFLDWLSENVRLVEITAFNDEDAYTIFETMNDRGLSLSPAEMLKGFLLAKISDSAKRASANALWKKRLEEFSEWEGETDADFFKAWLRSQYALKIRERKKGAVAEDFDRIGTEFHRWLRDHHEDPRPGLLHGDDFARFIQRDFDFYSRQYLGVREAAWDLTPGLEAVRYIADLGFTQAPMLLLAPLCPDDNAWVVRQKMRLVARFLDILLARRLWNFRSIAYSTLQYAMFLVLREIRGLDAPQLADKLRKMSHDDELRFDEPRFGLHQQNRNAVHCLLARLSDWVQTESGLPSQYDEWVNASPTSKTRFEIEHIWADKPERHRDELPNPADFAEMRNRIGALLLLPKSSNASYGALPYEKKREHYNTQNLLARSLHPLCYERNPGFLQFIARHKLPFRAHDAFKIADVEERSALYRLLAEQIWNPETLRVEQAP